MPRLTVGIQLMHDDADLSCPVCDEAPCFDWIFDPQPPGWTGYWSACEAHAVACGLDVAIDHNLTDLYTE